MQLNKEGHRPRSFTSISMILLDHDETLVLRNRHVPGPGALFPSRFVVRPEPIGKEAQFLKVRHIYLQAAGHVLSITRRRQCKEILKTVPAERTVSFHLRSLTAANSCIGDLGRQRCRHPHCKLQALHRLPGLPSALSAAYVVPRRRAPTTIIPATDPFVSGNGARRSPDRPSGSFSSFVDRVSSKPCQERFPTCCIHFEIDWARNAGAPWPPALPPQPSTCVYNDDVARQRHGYPRRGLESTAAKIRAQTEKTKSTRFLGAGSSRYWPLATLLCSTPRLPPGMSLKESQFPGLHVSTSTPWPWGGVPAQGTSSISRSRMHTATRRRGEISSAHREH